jgi:hypothetical protein
MNNPSWRSEDGQLLRSLREEAGIDELVFARTNTVSLAQLRELERGGNSSFYNPAIKRSTGVKLLKKLGHDLVTPEMVILAIEPTEPNVIAPLSAAAPMMAQASLSPPQPPSDSQPRGLFQPPFFWALSLLSLMALIAIKPWNLLDVPATDRRSAHLATQDLSSSALSTPAPTQPSPAKSALTQPPEPAQVIASAYATTEPPAATVKVSAPTVNSACDWQHRDNGKTHTPSQPLKPGNYVYLEAQADTELCVLDSQNQKTLLQLKAGMAKSVYGSAPFLVFSQDLHTLKLFFQGRRVHEALDDMQYLLLNSQPL